MSTALFISFGTNLFREYLGTRQTPIMFSPEQFETCFDEILSIVMGRISIPAQVLKWFRGEKHLHSIDRLVIVLDNVDRCDRKCAYELLSDFKNFLGKERVIFVIPVDDSALRTHVSSINTSNSEEADEFLRKIFNNTLKIKPYKTHDLYDFTLALSVEYELSLKPDTVDVIAKEYATNPRRIIQFINSLISEKNYLTRRMSAEFVAEFETVIALVLLIREEWHELYRELSDAPYKLKNLKQSLELASNNARKEIFLRKTQPHTANISDKTLKIVFANQEQYPKISDALITALSVRDSKTISEFVETSVDGVYHLTDYMIGELKHAAGRGVLASLSSTFNELVFLNTIFPFQAPTNKRIFGELNRDEAIHSCISNSDNAEHLAIYLNCLEEQSLYTPQNLLLDYLDSLVETDTGADALTPPLLSRGWSDLVINLVSHCHSKRLVTRLQKPFYIVFRDEDVVIEDIGVPGENISAVANQQLIDLIVSRDDFSNETRHAELMLLVSAGVVSVEVARVWIERFLSHHGSFANFTIDEFLNSLIQVTDVLSAGRFKLEEAILQPMAGAIFTPRARTVAGLPQTNISLIDEIAGDEEFSETLMDLFCWLYYSTTGKIANASGIIQIADTSSACELIVLKKLQWLHETFGFQLSPYHEFLKSRVGFNSSLLDIYKWLLVAQTTDKKYVLDDEKVNLFVEKCIEEIIAAGDAALLLENLFGTWVEDKRIKEDLTRAISVKEKAKISSLPQVIQATAYAHIAEGDNIFEYEDDHDLIAAMNRQDKVTFNKRIEKVILRKLVKDETFVDGLGLLEELESFKGMKIPPIRSQLEDKVDEPDIGDRIKSCLARLAEMKALS